MHSLRSKFKCFHLLWLPKYAEKQIQQNKSGLLSVWLEFENLHASLFCGGFPGVSGVKNLPTNAGDVGSSPGLRRSPGEGNSSPLQYSCLGNPMDRGTWQLQSTGSQRVRHKLTTKQQQVRIRNLYFETQCLHVFYPLNISFKMPTWSTKDFHILFKYWEEGIIMCQSSRGVIVAVIRTVQSLGH